VRFGDARLRHTAPVRSLALTSDGTRVLTATDQDRVLRLWDVKTGHLLRAVRVEEALTAWVAVLAITPDARKAFVMRHQHRQRDSSDPWHEPATVDLATGSVVRWPLGRKVERPHPIFALSSDGKTLAGIIGGEVRTWDFDSGGERVLGTIPKWLPDTGDICFSPDGSQIAASRGRGVFFVAPVNGNGALQGVPVKCANNEVCGVFWPRPNRVVALWCSGLAAFDPTTGAEIERSDEVAGGPGTIPVGAGGGKLFVKEEPTTPIATFDLATLARAPQGAARHSERAGAFTVSADGRVLAVVHGHAVRVFDPATGTPLHPDLERAPFEPLARLQISPDGPRVLGCTAADTAHAWELSDGRAPEGFNGSSWLLSSSALSPDGRLASGGLVSAGCPLVAELPSGRAFSLPAHEKGGRAFSLPAHRQNRHAPEVIGFTGPKRVWLWDQRANTCAPFEIGTNRLGPRCPGSPMRSSSRCPRTSGNSPPSVWTGWGSASSARTAGGKRWTPSRSARGGRGKRGPNHRPAPTSGSVRAGGGSWSPNTDWNCGTFGTGRSASRRSSRPAGPGAMEGSLRTGGSSRVPCGRRAAERSCACGKPRPGTRCTGSAQRGVWRAARSHRMGGASSSPTPTPRSACGTEIPSKRASAKLCRSRRVRSGTG
jgi:hypothetical protein